MPFIPDSSVDKPKRSGFVPDEPPQRGNIVPANEPESELKQALMSGPRMVGSIAKSIYGGVSQVPEMVQNPNTIIPTIGEAGKRVLTDIAASPISGPLGKIPGKTMAGISSLARGDISNALSNAYEVGQLANPLSGGTVVLKDMLFPGKYRAIENAANNALQYPVQKFRNEMVIPGANEQAAEGGAQLGNLALMAEGLRSGLKSGTKRNIPPIIDESGAVASIIPEKLLNNLSDKYRQILAPKKGNIKNVEIKAGKELNDSYKLAAENGLIIEKGPDNKLDTRTAVEQLQKPIDTLKSQVSDAIKSNPERRFNLNQIRESAKSRLREVFKNDSEYEDALKQVDNEIDAAIKNRGEQVNGVDLNEIKQGMWDRGYNALAPNSNKTARIIGNVAKDAIENAYPESNIKGLNGKLGDYYTLKSLLQDAHGNVIARGKLGKYISQGIGAVAGHSLGIPVGGELGGAYLGGKISDFLVNPERITSSISKRVSKYQPSQISASKTPIPPILEEYIKQDLLNKSSKSLYPKGVKDFEFKENNKSPQDVGQQILNDLIMKRYIEQYNAQFQNLPD